jgi:MinD-like ATPase involved in chromosome partitioning or flagellar assembly
MQRGYRVGLLDTDPKVGGLRTLFGLDETSERDLEAYWWLTPRLLSDTTLHAQFRTYDTPLESDHAGIYLPPLGGHFSSDGAQFQVLQQRYGQDKPYEVVQELAQDLGLDFLLIDNQPEISDDNLLGLSLADISVLLMQLDTYDLQRTAVLLEVIEQLEIAKTWLVPTLVLPTIETSVVRHMLENTYQHPVAGVLHLTAEMINLASRGVFCLHYPNHPLTQTLIAIAHNLEQDAQALSTSSTPA